MTDLFAKFNIVNKQLQGDDLNLIMMKSITSAFLNKLILWKQNFHRKEFSQFSALWDIHQKNEISFDGNQVFCEHLDSLYKDFTECFQEFYLWKFLNGSRILS